MPEQKRIEQSINLLLDICSLMMSSGADTKRVISSVNRFAMALNFEAHELISHKSIIMTLIDKLNNESYTVVTQIPKYHINFTFVSDISKLSWNVVDKNWTFNQIYEKFETIKSQKRFPLWLELLTVSLAGAGFANLFGGDYLNMLISFLATLVGFSVAKIATHYNVNIYAKIYLAAVAASLIASIGLLWQIGIEPQISLATSVLFLIPGAPLVNSFIDLFNNHILNGIVRFISGVLSVLAIGLGIITAMLIYNINNFM